jgi:SAM-dependent methyltransferase
MGELNHQAVSTWQDDEFSRSWANRDSMRGLLDFPRRIAARVVADDNPEPALVIDIGSGPGDFLAVFLEEFPDARGLWTDVSRAMSDLAASRLAAFASRVEFRIVDMTDLAGIPNGAAAVTTSRAAHHLDRTALHDFYAQAASHLKPGGWLINLDHIGPEETWNTRLRGVRKRFQAPGDAAESRQKHHHNYPLPSVQDHLDGYAAAGISDVEVVWRAFYTCLFMGRRAS